MQQLGNGATIAGARSLVQGGVMIVTQFSAGPTLGSTLIRSVVDSIDERFVVVQYLPISRVLSDTEYKASLRTMQLVIQITKPRMILSLDDDYLKYMPPNIYGPYKDKFYIANRGWPLLVAPLVILSTWLLSARTSLMRRCTFFGMIT